MKKIYDAESKLTYERSCIDNGAVYICGIDEVGRGPLAGPVTCTAIIMNLNDIVEGVDDSKKLSEKKREELFDKIVSAAIAVNTVSFDNTVIDEINILEATKRCMKAAIEGLAVKPSVVLIDALKLDIPYPQISIIKGDALSYSIGAASIVAKVTRDRLMRAYDQLYPQYGFASNKGYGSQTHIDAIRAFGATPIHRQTFIKNFVGGDK